MLLSLGVSKVVIFVVIVSLPLLDHHLLLRLLNIVLTVVITILALIAVVLLHDELLELSHLLAIEIETHLLGCGYQIRVNGCFSA